MRLKSICAVLLGVAAAQLFALPFQAAAEAPPRRLPRALLINLPHHEERFRKVTAELDAVGIEYERADAVNGKAMTREEMKANVTLLARALLTRGMVGCFLSHRACWQRCLDDHDGPILGETAAASKIGTHARLEG